MQTLIDMVTDAVEGAYRADDDSRAQMRRMALAAIKAVQENEMTLETALGLLADCHTRDDDLAGFVVFPPSDYRSGWHAQNYVTAWEVVRRHLCRNVSPA